MTQAQPGGRARFGPETVRWQFSGVGSSGNYGEGAGLRPVISVRKDLPFPPNGDRHIAVERTKERPIMLVVHVHVRVKHECAGAFAVATLENARQSVCEPGIARFDVVRQADDPERFVLIEAYRTVQAAAAHKETPHYQIWRDTVAPMMAEPRSSVKFASVFPDDAGW